MASKCSPKFGLAKKKQDLEGNKWYGTHNERFVFDGNFSSTSEVSVDKILGSAPAIVGRHPYDAMGLITLSVSLTSAKTKARAGERPGAWRSCVIDPTCLVPPRLVPGNSE